MDSSDVTQLIFLLILLLMSAFFSSAETALTTVNKIRIRSLAEEGNKRATILLKVVEDSGKMLSAILIGNNLVNIGSSSLATTLAISAYGSNAVGIATGVLTLLILVFGEITPKTLSTMYSERISLAYARIIYALMKVLTPVIYLVNKLAYLFMRLIRVNPNAKVTTITETELRTIVDVSHEEGVIESEERRIINNIFDFSDSQAKDVMIPRIDMIFADITSSYDDILLLFREYKYTRIPVFEGSTDNVIGILNVKDLLLCDHPKTFYIKDYMREPFFTYEYKKTSELLIEMRKNSINIAIVLDEYGGAAGLITLEDLLEEIVGEIRDEYDEDEINNIRKINSDEYIVEGMTKLSDLNDFLESDFESEDYDSIGGLIIEQLDRLPDEGDYVECFNARLVVDKIDKNRIDKVHIYIKEPAVANE